MAMKCCTKLETAKERCPIVFQGHPSNFKVTRYKTSPILTQIGRFQTTGRSQLSNPSDLAWWRSSVKFQGHMAKKIIDFDPDWAFLDCNSSLSSPMATKWCTKLEVGEKRCLIVFEGHLSNFKLKRLKKSSILTQIKHFRTVTPVWIHQWLRNDAKSFKSHRRGVLLFFRVIHQISRSHGLKNRRFESNLSKITRPVAAIKSLRFALFYIMQHHWLCLDYNLVTLSPLEAQVASSVTVVRELRWEIIVPKFHPGPASLQNSLFLIGLWRDFSISLLQFMRGIKLQPPYLSTKTW